MLAAVLIVTFAAIFSPVACRGGPSGTDYVEGELLVKFHSGVSEARMVEVHRSLGNRLVESWPGIRWYRVLLKEGVTVPEGIQQYRRLPEVENAEPNFQIRLQPPRQVQPKRLPQ